VPPFLVRLAHPPSKASVALREPIDLALIKQLLHTPLATAAT